MSSAIKHVDILDLVRIHVYPGTPTKGDPAPYRVYIESLDKAKKVVFDTKALQTFNSILTEKAATFDFKDPKAKNYIEEFVSKMTSEMYKNGLIEIEEIPDQPNDPYAAIRDKADTFKN